MFPSHTEGPARKTLRHIRLGVGTANAAIGAGLQVTFTLNRGSFMPDLVGLASALTVRTRVAAGAVATAPTVSIQNPYGVGDTADLAWEYVLP